MHALWGRGSREAQQRKDWLASLGDWDEAQNPKALGAGSRRRSCSVIASRDGVLVNVRSASEVITPKIPAQRFCHARFDIWR